jgi:large subunit ribosomal protein L6
MSRIGKKPIAIPGGVSVEINANMISVKGPLGADSCEVHSGISVTVDNNIMELVNSNPESDTLRANAWTLQVFDCEHRYGCFRRF